jgi:hypothetical protein
MKTVAARKNRTPGARLERDQAANGVEKSVVGEKRKMAKTYNSGYSLVVTHLTTNPPVRCLNRAERTGSLVFNVLWSYVKELISNNVYIVDR